jgi:2-keto-4-pentenoate hydratase
MPHFGESQALSSTRGLIQTLTPGASPYTYTATADGAVIVNGGTVSLIAFVRAGTVVGTGETAGMFPVRSGDGIRVTYSVVPTMRFVPN